MNRLELKLHENKTLIWLVLGCLYTVRPEQSSAPSRSTAKRSSQQKHSPGNSAKSPVLWQECTEHVIDREWWGEGNFTQWLGFCSKYNVYSISLLVFFFLRSVSFWCIIGELFDIFHFTNLLFNHILDKVTHIFHICVYLPVSIMDTFASMILLLLLFF